MTAMNDELLVTPPRPSSLLVERTRPFSLLPTPSPSPSPTKLSLHSTKRTRFSTSSLSIQTLLSSLSPNTLLPSANIIESSKFKRTRLTTRELVESKEMKRSPGLIGLNLFTQRALNDDDEDDVVPVSIVEGKAGYETPKLGCDWRDLVGGDISSPELPDSPDSLTSSSPSLSSTSSDDEDDRESTFSDLSDEEEEEDAFEFDHTPYVARRLFSHRATLVPSPPSSRRNLKVEEGLLGSPFVVGQERDGDVFTHSIPIRRTP